MKTLEEHKEKMYQESLESLSSRNRMLGSMNHNLSKEITEQDDLIKQLKLHIGKLEKSIKQENENDSNRLIELEEEINITNIENDELRDKIEVLEKEILKSQTMMRQYEMVFAERAMLQIKKEI